MKNELNLTSHHAIPESVIEPEGEHAAAAEPILTFPPIASFWRRLFAWLVDILILGVIGNIIGFTFSSFFYNIGPYGRPIGLLFTIPYFGIMNSRMGGGQTFGKRWMKIAVRNNENESIGLWRSIIRISVLTLPILFNQWAIPAFENQIVTWFLSLIIFGLGGAVLYTMVFNRKARQGVHDLLLGTYVVHLPGRPIQSFPVSSRIHWNIAGAWMGIVAMGALVMALVTPNIISTTGMGSLEALHKILQDDSRFFTVVVGDQTSYGSNGETSRSLHINLWYRGKIDESTIDEIAESVMKIVLENGENINDYDLIRVQIQSAFDIGIASGKIFFQNTDTVEGWQQRVHPNGTTNGSISGKMVKAFAIP